MKVVQVNYYMFKMSSKLVHLLMGFKELGIKSWASEGLGQEFLIRREGSRSLTLLELVFEDGSIVKFWFDLGASPKAYPSIVRDDELYFKIQYHKRHEEYSFIRPIAESVSQPGGYVSSLDFLRQEKVKKDYRYDVVGLFRKVSLHKRVECVRRVLEQRKWNSYISVYDNCGLHLSNTGLVKKLPYEEHLKLQAHSKICLSIADKACRCFRDTEILGFGGCLLVFGLDDYPDFPHDKPCWISIKEDFSDFIEKVNYYLQHDEEREAIAKRGLEYYKRYLSPKAMAKMVLNQCEKLKSKGWNYGAADTSVVGF